MREKKMDLLPQEYHEVVWYVSYILPPSPSSPLHRVNNSGSSVIVL